MISIWGGTERNCPQEMKSAHIQACREAGREAEQGSRASGKAIRVTIACRRRNNQQPATVLPKRLRTHQLRANRRRQHLSPTIPLRVMVTREGPNQCCTSASPWKTEQPCSAASSSGLGSIQSANPMPFPRLPQGDIISAMLRGRAKSLLIVCYGANF